MTWEIAITSQTSSESPIIPQKHPVSLELDNPTCQYIDYSVCKVPALHPRYFTAKVSYLKVLDKAQLIGDRWGDCNILVDPLKLCDKKESAAFDFMSEVKNVYLKAITTIEV